MVMSRNDQAHFSQAPQVDIQRSRFKRPSRLLTTMNAGKLIPIFVDECLPGDTVSLDTAALVRMSTPIFPVMDNCYLDVYYFFVPNRLLWEHWKEFNGENNTTYWTQPTEYNVPMLYNPTGGWNKGSVADYMGIPTDVGGDYKVSALPFRAYTLIWNEFFRDQNYMAPAYFNKSDNGARGHTAGPGLWDGITSALYGGSPLPVSKFHDYFTSCLPSPQKGEPMELPFFHDDYIPVSALSKSHDFGVDSIRFSGAPLSDSVAAYISDDLILKADYSQSYEASEPAELIPGNLWADMTAVSVGTINELRQAFQIQRLLEKDARGGTRYTEILNAHFGVTSPDARLQRPEYLGGKRVPIKIDQVIQTSSTDETSPQGNTAAFSLTSDVDSSFTKSFTEHGWLLGLCCIRTDHTYQQGLDKMWSRERRFDFYWPSLAHISEQPVLRKEIFLSDNDTDYVNEEVFGYQEAWAEYRYKPSRVSGAFRSNYQNGTLDSWHYADYFGEPNGDPFIADRDFMAETNVNIDRTLAVQSSVEDQFLCNFFFDATWVRPMPLYSVPGLIDHF